jgi:hypothetical protein
MVFNGLEEGRLVFIPPGIMSPIIDNPQALLFSSLMRRILSYPCYAFSRNALARVLVIRIS